MTFFSKLTRFNDWGLLVLRLGIAVVFFAHGMFKWSLWGMEPSEQLPASMLTILKILSIAEPLGAIAMLIGFWTPIASIGMGILMLGVINMKITMMTAGFIGEQTTGWELDFIILCAVVCVFFTGPGKISLERVLSKRSNTKG
jgi:putative oxidoreductase